MATLELVWIGKKCDSILADSDLVSVYGLLDGWGIGWMSAPKDPLASRT